MYYGIDLKRYWICNGQGVVFGVICTITVLPAMILAFDKLIHKYNIKRYYLNLKKFSICNKH